MAISVSKSIPTSAFYTGSGATTVTLKGVQDIIINTKKSLIKINIPRSTSRQNSSPSDFGDNKIKDLQRVETTIKFRCFVEDGDSETAWNKFWKLRAMCSSGGALSSLVIENLTFSSGQTTAFLEEVTGTAPPFQGKTINTNSNLKAERIACDLTFYIGEAR